MPRRMAATPIKMALAYPDNFTCYYLIGHRDGWWTSLEFDAFESDPDDYMQITERIEFNNTKYDIPRAFLRGSQTQSTPFISGDTGSDFLLTFRSGSGGKSAKRGYGFHLTVKRTEDTEATPARCRTPINFVDPDGQRLETDKPGNEFDPGCTKLLLAPEGKTIHFNALNASSNAIYYVADFDEVWNKKRMSSCKEELAKGTDPNSLLTHYYESFTNKLIVMICPTFTTEQAFAFDVITQEKRCICTRSSYVFNEIYPKHFYSSPNFGHGICENFMCAINVVNEMKDNQTHFWSVYLEIKKRHQLPELPTFALLLSGFDADENELFSLNSTAPLSHKFGIAAKNFTIISKEGGVQLHLRLYASSIDCSCFNGGKQMLELEIKEPTMSRGVDFWIPKDCPPQDCWVRVKNRPGMILSVVPLANVALNHNERFELLLDGKLKRAIYSEHEYGLATFFTDEYGNEMNTTNYIYFHLSTRNRTEGNFSETNITMRLEWSRDCKCQEETINLVDDQPRIITSPRYPENYCDSLHCIYHFNAEEGIGIKFKVLDYDLAPDGDQLYYFEKNAHTHHPQLENGSSKTITGNYVAIVFVSDSSDTARGFKIQAETYLIPKESSGFSY
ncbi:unnamed protein product, partial [Mesorhabditis belari]|uniref:CUB domain-containing protein n=1 Tax=Mesorhabditis belari TaxID=2138241 RepID=A0AAF3FKD0_9BILA